jgi:hypothetical protein
MFKKQVPKYKSLLEEELEHTIKTLRSHVAGSEDYVNTLGAVERLHEMLEEEKPDSVSKNTWANIGANLLGILMIIKYESVNVIRTKAINFVTRPKI